MVGTLFVLTTAFAVVVLVSGAIPLHFNQSSKTSSPPDPELMYCANIAGGISICFLTTNLPFCNGTKSDLQSCLDKFNPSLDKCKYPLLTTALRQRIATAKTSDDILCKNRLYKEFQNNLPCWELGKIEMINISGQGTNLLTDIGCKIAKLNFDIIIGYGYVYQKCSKPLTNYLKPLFDTSYCGH